MDIQKIKKIIEMHAPEIKKTFSVREIGLFGSYVKGTERPESDVDILVVFEKGHKDFFNYMRLRYYIEGLIGKKVDLVIKDAVKPQLREKIFKEVVYV